MTAANSQVRSFNGLRASRPVKAQKVLQTRAGRSSQVVRAGFIGSPENVIVVVSTTLFLTAGRFGLAPTVRRQATSGLRLVDAGNKGLSTGDPSGFTAVDVLAHGTMGHVIAVGAILGLRAIGKI
jgi:photosystem I subunit 10